MKIPESGFLVKGRDIWEAEYADMKIDRKKVEKCSHNHRGSIRISTGRYYTKQEYEARKERVVNTPLP